jgi:hypothetical protein
MGAVTYGLLRTQAISDLGHLNPTFVDDLLDRLDDGPVDVEVEALGRADEIAAAVLWLGSPPPASSSA